MKPYYEGNGIQLYLGDNVEVVAALGLGANDVDLLWCDPSYGVSEKVNRRTRSRGVNAACPSGGHRARARDWAPLAGDDAPFDPRPWLGRFWQRPAVFWGANHYAHLLPPSPTWWWWDKRRGTTPDDNADGELAWTNLGGPARQYTHLWRGLCRDSEKANGGKHLHPTQKPVLLCDWGFHQAKLRPGQLVVSPWAGSCPEAVAARARGLRLIAIDVHEPYLAACVQRLAGPTLPFWEDVRAPEQASLLDGC